MRNTLQQSWYALSLEEIFSVLHSSHEGLSSSSAEQRIREYGLNVLPEKNGEGVLHIFFRQFANIFVAILSFAAIASFALGDQVDAFLIFGIIMLNVIIGFIQEFKVFRILQQLKKHVDKRAVVRRDGAVHEIDAEFIVPGDVLLIRQGERVVADARVLRAVHCEVNESLLTGESFPVQKKAVVLGGDTVLADRVNMVFMGTLIESGMVEAIVVETGAKTEFGKIGELVKRGERGDVTPMQKKFSSLARILGVAFVGASALLFVFGLFLGHDIADMFLTSIAVAVGAVPEGLPIALSIALAIGAERILKKGGLVRRMVAAEALGETTVIAADKTATLTEGVLRLVGIVFSPKQIIEMEELLKVIERKGVTDELLTLRYLGLLSEAFIENPSAPRDEWQMRGKPLDKAILYALHEVGIDKADLDMSMPRVDVLPFRSQYKYSAALHRIDDRRNVVIVFGAPDVLLQDVVIDKRVRDELYNSVAYFAGEGFRVLMLAYKDVSSSLEYLERDMIGDLTFLSLILFSDPIRKEAFDAVRTSERAGVRVVMVTGDHRNTAAYIGRELGILKDEQRIIEGRDLPKDLQSIVNEYDIFARVSPEDKVNIVTALQKNGETVAMLGDGINDAPSLIRGDLGVALGSGTEVAKEAADLVLLNDSFAIIVEAIRQGRIILDNVKKSITFLLSDAFSEIMLIAGSVFLGLPLPLLPVQILWVNLIEGGFPAVALAFEKEDGDVMARKPRRGAVIFTQEMKLFITTFAIVTNTVLFSIFYFYLKNTGDISYARTMVFVGLGITSLFYIFSLKSLRKPIWSINIFSNAFLNISVVIGIGLYMIALYVPWASSLLRTVPLSSHDWVLLVLFGVLNIFFIEVGKFRFLKSESKD